MKKLSPNDSLNNAIVLLEIKRNEELREIKQHFHVIHEGLKPINLVKNLVKSVSHSKSIKDDMNDGALQFAAKYLIKFLIFRNSNNPVKIGANLALQSIISKAVSDHSDEIKSFGSKILLAILSKFNKEKKQEYQLHN